MGLGFSNLILSRTRFGGMGCVSEFSLHRSINITAEAHQGHVKYMNDVAHG